MVESIVKEKDIRKLLICNNIDYLLNRIKNRRISVILFFKRTFNSSKEKALQKRLSKAIEEKGKKEVLFGNYVQGLDGQAKPIAWTVIKKEQDKVLLLAKYCLDNRPFNEKYEQISWFDCTLRKWLNNCFFNQAFDGTEKKLICEEKTPVSKNQSYGTNTNNGTSSPNKDRVFILSAEEVEEWLPEDENRKAGATKYAKRMSQDRDQYVWWWLRTPGVNYNHACHVFKEGMIHFEGHNVDMNADMVRPAIWVKLK